uniref:Uncharacterized protein n=1 Tax=Macrostomum lignano TaxID=282301 RepID=A0A1I8F6P2_9PLAT
MCSAADCSSYPVPVLDASSFCMAITALIGKRSCSKRTLLLFTEARPPSNTKGNQ